jgi:hypothetical protein
VAAVVVPVAPSFDGGGVTANGKVIKTWSLLLILDFESSKF